MIVIVSDSLDESTNSVIDWLHFYGEEVVRINNFTLEKSTIRIKSNTSSLVFKSKKLNNIKSVWFRKIEFLSAKRDNIMDEIQKHLNEESWAYYQSMRYYLSKYKCFGYFENTTNKYNVLMEASKVGFEIPNTLITTSKSDLITFKKTKKKIVTKCIKDCEFFF